MIERYGVYSILLIAWSAAAVCVAGVLLFVPAPYGRFSRPGWGPVIPARWGWVVMESVSLISFNIFYFWGGLSGSGTSTLGTLPFLILWNCHYTHRSFIYPILMREANGKMAVSVVGMAAVFNSANGFFNGRYFHLFGQRYTGGWFLDIRFVLGIVFFVAGLIINLHSDAVLRRLRRQNGSDYSVPQGGLFRFVSCANYLGEIMEWLGWACLTWSPAALAFALWTCGNLIPRGISNHRWYRRQFPEYPSSRKAVIPFVL